ncbi:MAG TPA: hypothetical protein VML75_18765 [Kofleriaceae bacterium]|nr:hypothetical protein [Kofleriaceae bacterium]
MVRFVGILQTLSVAALAAAVVACGNDPRYLTATDPLELNAPGSMAGEANATIDLPIRIETDDELAERQALAAELGVEVPYVKLADVHVSLEWSLKNLADAPGTATILLNGGTEFASFVPTNFVIDPEEDDEPPPLIGGVPMVLQAGEIRTGVFREDQIAEGSVDLELMYRVAYNAIAAVLEVNRGLTQITDPITNAVIPNSVFASMVRFEIMVRANTHMVFEYGIRIRDDRGILHEDLLEAPPEELTGFNPVEIQPPMVVP